jgi:DNA polymerase beta thumb
VCCRLVAKRNGKAWLVPCEGPPLNPHNRDEEEWPEGWSSARRVETERDIFELLRLPYRQPSERDC